MVAFKGDKIKNKWGAARKDVPVYKNINKNGFVSYTIALKKAEELKTIDSLMIDNLFIQENNKGEQRMCVIRYKPEETWYNQADRSLKNFSGRVELYDLQGRSLGKSTLVNGELAPEKATLAVTECIYEFYMATELLGYTTYTYRLKSCSTTLYGDAGGNNYNNYMDSSSYQGSSWNIGYGEDGRPTTGTGGKDDDDVTSPPLLPLEPSDATFENIDASELKGKEECLNNLLDQKGNSFVQKLLSKFRGDGTEFDIKISSQDSLWSEKSQKFVNGLAKSPVNNVIEIQISSTHANMNSALYVAKTILHEYIHADIFRKLKTKYPTNYELDFKKTFEQYQNDHHETMGNLYITQMRDALKNFHQNALPNDYNAYINHFGTPPTDLFYEALVWQGLRNDDIAAYNELSEEKKLLLAAEEQKLGILSKKCPENN